MVAYCRSLYREHGPQALTFQALRSHDNLYFTLHSRGIGQKQLLAHLGLAAELKAHRYTLDKVRDGKKLERWTWERVREAASEIKVRMGHLPPASWFQANGYGSLVGSVYYLGKTWEDLRQDLGDFNSSQFVESRNGLRWRSHPEASLSNFLHARGIPHRRGQRYPDEYALVTGRSYGMYDLHFDGLAGEVDVEIWGDKPKGHGEADYAEKRRGKEMFNADNPRFLGIGFNYCFSDEILTSILVPHIGKIAPFVFDRPADREIESSHWSNADELLAFCRQLATQMPDGAFPTEEWLRKRGKFADRDGPTYNTASVYIKKWLGGVRTLRTLLGQGDVSTLQWDRESALARWLAFWQAHGATPSQVRHSTRSGASQYAPEVVREAGNLTHAIVRYADGADAANSALGIVVDPTRRWTHEAILEGYRDAIARWGAAPGQVLSDHRSGKSLLSEIDAKRIGQMVDAAGRNGGSLAIYEALDFTPPKRPRRKRRTRDQMAAARDNGGR